VRTDEHTLSALYRGHRGFLERIQGESILACRRIRKNVVLYRQIFVICWQGNLVSDLMWDDDGLSLQVLWGKSTARWHLSYSFDLERVGNDRFSVIVSPSLTLGRGRTMLLSLRRLSIGVGRGLGVYSHRISAVCTVAPVLCCSIAVRVTLFAAIFSWTALCARILRWRLLLLGFLVEHIEKLVVKHFGGLEEEERGL
jgi:hypothetical protein